VFTGDLGCTLLHLVENEWVRSLHNWDIEIVGQRLTVRRGRRDISLQLRLDHRVGSLLNVLICDGV
jgi:hypothetical protein